jgi:hypothetical protein
LRSGYGVLPEVRSSAPHAHAQRRETRYELTALDPWLSKIQADAERLRARLGPEAGRVDLIERDVTEYERLRAAHDKIQEHLRYHAFWQQAVLDRTAYFEGRNRIIAQVEELDALRRGNGAPSRIAELERRVHDEVAPFAPASGPRLLARQDGGRALAFTLYTDIEDRDFLDQLRAAIECEFDESEAARSLRFVLELEIVVMAPSELYPEGAPGHGSTIATEEHLARFPEGAAVLTTGAESTHAWRGNSLLLGPAPVTRRTLAHELGHLLGFSDAYLRGFEGQPGGEHGVVLVEWTGVVDDLMGNPGGGKVTREMVERLLEAYGD